MEKKKKMGADEAVTKKGGRPAKTVKMAVDKEEDDEQMKEEKSDQGRCFTNVCVLRPFEALFRSCAFGLDVSGTHRFRCEVDEIQRIMIMIMVSVSGADSKTDGENEKAADVPSKKRGRQAKVVKTSRAVAGEKEEEKEVKEEAAAEKTEVGCWLCKIPPYALEDSI